MTLGGCIRRIYQTSGLLGFYKGISASYVGISETVIHFVIYEALKAKLVRHAHNDLIVQWSGTKLADLSWADYSSWNDSVRRQNLAWLPWVHAGRRMLQDYCLVHCLSARGGANATARGGQQVPIVLANVAHRVRRGGQGWHLQVIALVSITKLYFLPRAYVWSCMRVRACCPRSLVVCSLAHVEIS